MLFTPRLFLWVRNQGGLLNIDCGERKADGVSAGLVEIYEYLLIECDEIVKCGGLNDHA